MISKQWSVFVQLLSISSLVSGACDVTSTPLPNRVHLSDGSFDAISHSNQEWQIWFCDLFRAIKCEPNTDFYQSPNMFNWYTVHRPKYLLNPLKQGQCYHSFTLIFLPTWMWIQYSLSFSSGFVLVYSSWEDYEALLVLSVSLCSTACYQLSTVWYYVHV